ncbi:MAG: hypothetical protein DRI73_08575 [Bacteroidetes bacterium]|nr:MAG: hypothetical protein DRI73_08575 [Bacteroidota bacterium]
MEPKQTRRKFLRNGLLAVTGSSVIVPSIAGSTRNGKEETAKQDFVYRTLGKTGIKIPIVSMGTGNTDNPALIRAAIDKGVKLFATSEYYHNGNNEKMLGEVLKDRPRDSFHIMTGTNGGLEIDYKNGLFKPETDPNAYLESANGCLKRLQVEYVDFFSLGFAARRESVFYEPLLKALETFKKQGKTKYLGIGTHKFEPEAIRAAADTGVFDVVMTAYNFKKNNIAEIEEAINYAAGKGMGIIAMKTMAGAYWDKERTMPINTRAALKWVLNNENIHTTVPDCSSFDQLDQDLNLMGDYKLTEDEKQDLELTSDKLSTGIYCQQCGKCIPQCKEGLDIPTIMRSYMYAYGYKNLAHAKHTLQSASVPVSACSGCATCTIDCTMGFDISKKLADINRLSDVPEEFLT